MLRKIDCFSKKKTKDEKNPELLPPINICKENLLPHGYEAEHAKNIWKEIYFKVLSIHRHVYSFLRSEETFAGAKI